MPNQRKQNFNESHCREANGVRYLCEHSTGGFRAWGNRIKGSRSRILSGYLEIVEEKCHLCQSPTRRHGNGMRENHDLSPPNHNDGDVFLRLSLRDPRSESVAYRQTTSRGEHSQSRQEVQLANA